MAKKKPLKPPEYSEFGVEAQRELLTNEIRRVEAELYVTRLNLRRFNAQLVEMETNTKLKGLGEAVLGSQRKNLEAGRTGGRVSVELLLTNIATTKAELAKLPPPPDDSEE